MQQQLLDTHSDLHRADTAIKYQAKEYTVWKIKLKGSQDEVLRVAANEVEALHDLTTVCEGPQ